jgi:hypothetical protein
MSSQFNANAPIKLLIILMIRNLDDLGAIAPVGKGNYSWSCSRNKGQRNNNRNDINARKPYLREPLRQQVAASPRQQTEVLR